MALPVFPALKGLSWPVKRSARFSNVPQVGVTGKRTFVRLQIEPRWQYELSIEFARSAAGFTEFTDLLTVFQTCYGSYSPFLFDDVYDNSVTDQEIGIGDGMTRDFFLLRSLGGFAQRVAALNGTPTIKLNGVIQTATFSVSPVGIISLGSPPAPGQLITWSGFYRWICRFDEDQIDLAQFMPNFWEAKSVKFSTEIITG